MPVDALETLASFGGIFLGAVGHPDIPDSETLWGMLIPIRRAFDQYINLRPIESLPGVVAPIATQTGIDLVIVRENVEGEYSAIGGRSYSGQPEEAAYQLAVFTRRSIARTARYAAELARTRTGHLTSATKSNGIIHTMTFWDEVVKEVVGTYADIALSSILVDALAANLVMHPDRFDVIVASNLFGDILSDIAAATVGSIGIAPSANLNPERKSPSMFEPVHGSTPDIAGRGIANPLGQIWAGSLMLDHLGHAQAAADIKRAFREALALGVATADLGGAAGTVEFTNAVLDALAAN
jgi:tartrate dehydrogenase/decarboxylase/D-malate dehydrogenase